MTMPSSATLKNCCVVPVSTRRRWTRRSGWNQTESPRSLTRWSSQKRTSPTVVRPGVMTSSEKARRVRMSVTATAVR